jgi:flavin-dependent dehydrogenase
MFPQQDSDQYDVVIVGARAAGAATALLLARAGLDVLVLDRSRYGDDTLSTHALMRGAVLQLHRWGLLPQIVDAGTPAVRRTTFQVGEERTSVEIRKSHGVDALYAPRRTVLDPVLVDAAVAAGAEIRHGHTVIALRRDAAGRVIGVTAQDGDGRSFDVTAGIVIGADGMNSAVARWAQAPVRRAGTSAGAFVYGYWRGLATDGFEWFFRPGGAAGVIPTNDSHACVFVGTSPTRFRRDLVRRPVDGYLALLDTVAPELAVRLAGAERAEELFRFPGRTGFIRRPFGPGWALVGDAGYFKDPIAAHGLTDALRDAELLARAVIDVAVHGRDELAAFEEYEATRDRLSGSLFDTADCIASFAWDVTEVSALLLRLSASMNEEVETLATLDLAYSALTR